MVVLHLGIMNLVAVVVDDLVCLEDRIVGMTEMDHLILTKF